jgi:transcriptional regulator with XRE-family HTH domain
VTESDYAEELGRRLRAARHHRGLSLLDVQVRSRGRWTPGTLGAYERGSRSLRVHKLVELAELYEVSTTVLLPARTTARADGLPPVTIDLARLRRLPPTRTGPLRRWIAIVQVLRDDHSRDVLSLRRTDLHALAKLYSTTPLGLYERIGAWGVLATAATAADTPAPRRRGTSRAPATRRQGTP